MSSNVEQIKERLGVVEVVGSYVKLEKAGSNYKARCPFHNEKTPSFFVSPSRGSYYCFGCNAKGDIFSFVEQFEGLDFVGALKVLAQRAGVELVRENPKVKNERDRLYRVLDAATEFFERSLLANKEAIDYLSKRGVKEATIKEWRLGFAPNEWQALHDELIKKGFSPDEMMKVGLVKKSEQSRGFYDMFRGRVMFPIADSSGRVIAFSGRIMPALDDGKSGKYVNSPETALFNKSRVLYGLHKAKFDIRKRDYSIMVEGQMDLVMSHQAGFTNTVAVSGTALSADIVAGDAVTNLGLLTRLSNNIILAFDSDEAGFKATARNARTALSLGMDVKVAKMPAGEDPADIILRDVGAWKSVIKDSKHIIDFSVETLLEKKLEQRKLGHEVQVLVLPFVAALRSAIDQSHFVNSVSKKTGIKEEALWAELKKLSSPQSTVPASRADSSTGLSRKRGILRKLAAVLYWQEGKSPPMLEAAPLWKSLQDIMGEEEWVREAEALSGSKNELAFEAEVAYERVSDIKKEVDELLLNLEEEVLSERLATAMKKLYEAERAKAKGEVQAALGLCHDLSARISSLKARRQALAVSSTE